MWLKLTNRHERSVGVNFSRVVRIESKENASILHFDKEVSEDSQKMTVNESIEQIISLLNGAGGTSAANNS